MKYVVLLISFYCAFLSVLPCQDQEESSADVNYSIIQKGHAGDNCSQETCPPFCNCTCCSSARQIAPKTALTVITESLSFEYPQYHTPRLQSQAISIWQPPQIS